MNAQSTQHLLSGLKILVVEDWLVVAQEIEALLQDLGCEVLGPVPKLEPAIEIARNEGVDGAILDVNLDDREVYPVADELLVRGVPFFFMTGYDERTLTPEFRNWPRLEKPFGAEAFRDKLVEVFIHNPPAPTTPAMRMK